MSSASTEIENLILEETEEHLVLRRGTWRLRLSLSTQDIDREWWRCAASVSERTDLSEACPVVDGTRATASHFAFSRDEAERWIEQQAAEFSPLFFGMLP